ncbi:MAG: hypothetical protein ABFC85_11530 [Rectinema sp.]
MTPKEVIVKYLQGNGFDGLAGEDCGCGLDDLAPCESCNTFECSPAYRTMCDGNPKPDEDGETDHDCIGSPHEMFTTAKPEQKP